MMRNSLVLEGKVYFVYLRQWWLLRLKSVQSSLFSLLNEGKGRQLKVCRILYYLLLSKCRTEVSTRLTSPFLILDQLQQTQSQSNPLWSFHLGLLVALFFCCTNRSAWLRNTSSGYHLRVQQNWENFCHQSRLWSQQSFMAWMTQVAPYVRTADTKEMVSRIHLHMPR